MFGIQLQNEGIAIFDKKIRIQLVEMNMNEMSIE